MSQLRAESGVGRMAGRLSKRSDRGPETGWSGVSSGSRVKRRARGGSSGDGLGRREAEEVRGDGEKWKTRWIVSVWAVEGGFCGAGLRSGRLRAADWTRWKDEGRGGAIHAPGRLSASAPSLVARAQASRPRSGRRAAWIAASVLQTRPPSPSPIPPPTHHSTHSTPPARPRRLDTPQATYAAQHSHSPPAASLQPACVAAEATKPSRRSQRRRLLQSHACQPNFLLCVPHELVRHLGPVNTTSKFLPAAAPRLGRGLRCRLHLPAAMHSAACEMSLQALRPLSFALAATCPRPQLSRLPCGRARQIIRAPM